MQKIFVVLLFTNSFSLVFTQYCSVVTENTPYRTYKVFSEPVIFETAEANCNQLGGHLVSIGNEVDAELIENFARTPLENTQATDFWIGATFSNGEWSWTDGSPWNYTFWYPGKEPRLFERGAALIENGRWITAYPTDMKPYVCGTKNTNQQQQQQECPMCPICNPPTRRCESGWTFFEETNSCYKVVRNMTFVDAEFACQNMSSHLTSIHSDDENNFITDLVSLNQDIVLYEKEMYMGLMRSGDSWFWTDGTKFDYHNWADKEPSNYNGVEDCVQLYADPIVHRAEKPQKYKWNSTDCTWYMRVSVCKKEATTS